MAHPLPEAGDIVLVDFEPTVGREQAGQRPALVLSNALYHARASYILVCPITRNLNPWPFKVALPSGMRVKGAILVDQIKSVDRNRRVLRHLGSAPAECLAQVQAKLLSLLDITLLGAGREPASD